MKIEIDAALKSHPSDEVLVEGFRIQIKRQDMSTLSGLNWLNDEVSSIFLAKLRLHEMYDFGISKKNPFRKFNSVNNVLFFFFFFFLVGITSRKIVW